MIQVYFTSIEVCLWWACGESCVDISCKKEVVNVCAACVHVCVCVSVCVYVFEHVMCCAVCFHHEQSHTARLSKPLL